MGSAAILPSPTVCEVKVPLSLAAHQLGRIFPALIEIHTMLICKLAQYVCARSGEAFSLRSFDGGL